MDNRIARLNYGVNYYHSLPQGSSNLIGYQWNALEELWQRPDGMRWFITKVRAQPSGRMKIQL